MGRETRAANARDRQISAGELSEKKRRKREYLKRYYKENREKIRAQQREYQKRYHETHRETMAEYQHRYYLENKDEYRERSRNYWRQHQEELLAKDRARRAERRKLKHGREEQQENQNQANAGQG